MLNMLKRPKGLTKFLSRKFTIERGDRETLLKMCQMLGIEYKDNNEEIPVGTKIRLIDGETNQFYGIFGIDAAM